MGFPVRAISRSTSTVHAKNAQLDLPAYGKGTLDADVALKKLPLQTALLSGNVALSNATLPFSSFLQAAQSGAGKTGPPIPLAFDLQASAGKNVRVRGSGYGAGLDIGTSGSVKLGGTLAAPTLAGTIHVDRRNADVFRQSVPRAERQRLVRSGRRRAAEHSRRRGRQREQPRSRQGAQSVRHGGYHDYRRRPDRGTEDRLHARSRPAIRRIKSSRCSRRSADLLPARPSTIPIRTRSNRRAASRRWAPSTCCRRASISSAPTR